MIVFALVALSVSALAIALAGTWEGPDTTMPSVAAGRALRRCAEMAKPVCASGACYTGRHGCCHRVWCDCVDRALLDRGIVIEQPWVRGVPFMGEQGCVVAEHLRPICSSYVCRRVDPSRLPEGAFATPEFCEEFDRVRNVAFEEPGCVSMNRYFAGVVVVTDTVAGNYVEIYG